KSDEPAWNNGMDHHGKAAKPDGGRCRAYCLRLSAALRAASAATVMAMVGLLATPQGARRAWACPSVPARAKMLPLRRQGPPLTRLGQDTRRQIPTLAATSHKAFEPPKGRCRATVSAAAFCGLSQPSR